MDHVADTTVRVAREAIVVTATATANTANFAIKLFTHQEPSSQGGSFVYQYLTFCFFLFS